MRAAGFGLERLIEREQGGRRWLGMARPVIVLTTMAPISLGSTLAAPHRAFCHFLERVESWHRNTSVRSSQPCSRSYHSEEFARVARVN